MIDAARRSGQPVPAPFNDPPTVHQSFAVFLVAFHEMSEQRPRDDARIHPVGRKLILEWCQSYGWHRDLDFMQELAAYVRALDPVWIEWELKRRKEARTKAAQERAANRAKGKTNGEPPDLRKENARFRERYTETSK